MHRCGFPTANNSFCRRKGKEENFRCYAHREKVAAPSPSQSAPSCHIAASTLRDTTLSQQNAIPTQSAERPAAPPIQSAAAPAKEDTFLDACPICCEDVYQKEDAQLTCKHAIHVECAAQLHRPKCPICCRSITAAEGKLTKMHLKIIKQREKKTIEEERQREEEESFAHAVAFHEDMLEDQEGLVSFFDLIISIALDIG